MTNGTAERADQHELAERVVAAIRTHGSPAYPRAFEVWYAQLSSAIPALNAELQQVMASGGGSVGATAIDSLYDRYIGALSAGLKKQVVRVLRSWTNWLV